MKLTVTKRLVLLLSMVFGLLLGTHRAQAQLNLNKALRSNGASATASSLENNDLVANNAIDGDFSTRWSSQFSDPQTLLIDLGAVQTIDRVRISWETAYASSFAIDLSTDGTNFTPVTTITNNTPTLRNSNQNVNEYPNLNGGTARYVRMRGLTRATQYGYSIWEFEVYSFSNPATSLSLGKQGYASDTQSNFVPNNAFDGDDNTRWSTLNTSNQYLYVDLMANATISRIYLNWEKAYGVDFQLQASNDLTNWSTFATITGNHAYYDEISVYGTGRYVRMLGQTAGANTNGGFSLWEFKVFGTSTPLPVQLVSFAAQRQAATVALDWATASELHNHGFEVQRSANGTDFDVLSFVNGAGSSPTAHRYQYLDRAPLPGTSYYRLRQLDTDGTFAYSPTVAVAAPAAATAIAASAYPNPASGQLTLSWQASAASPARWELRDALGHLVQTSQFQAAAGANTAPVSLQGCAAGMYLLTLEAAGQAPQRLRVQVQ